MKKRQKKHLFARTCRVLGRFLLALGAILCIASVIFAVAPVLDQPKSDESSITDNTPVVIPPTNPAPTDQTPSKAYVYILPSIVVVTLALFLLGVSFRHYNRTIRNTIARVAKSMKLSISSTELVLATLIWAIVNIVMIFVAPLFAILTFAALIINDLLFIFAWTSYGCPVYTI